MCRGFEGNDIRELDRHCHKENGRNHQRQAMMTVEDAKRSSDSSQLTLNTLAKELRGGDRSSIDSGDYSVQGYRMQVGTPL